MSFMDLAKARYSVRKFSDKPVEEEKLKAILEAAKVAPTAKNNQPVKVYVIRSADALEKINRVSPCIYGAKLVLMVCYDPDKAYRSGLNPGINGGDVDAAIVCTHMMLEAADLGLGSCWVARFSRADAHRAFELPENIVPVALLPVGYAAKDAVPSPRHESYREDSELFAEL